MRVGVLVSGQGTNLQALIDAEARGALAPATIACVISNKPGVRALERAAAANIPAFVVPHADRARGEFEEAMLVHLRAAGVELVVLAGFMRILTTHFVDAFRDRIVNTHPSLLPLFPGADAPAQAIAAHATVSGATVHFVDDTLDGGPIIDQVIVSVDPEDNASTLHGRIQQAEHRLLPDVVRRLAAGELVCEGRTVRSVTRAQ